ncbi:hypothetical protein NSZ01_29420 [Nocardioides szechwanensis]|nr:hypothetical protein NSZ01_29420 [Nocardioides szechwanensis]
MALPQRYARSVPAAIQRRMVLTETDMASAASSRLAGMDDNLVPSEKGVEDLRFLSVEPRGLEPLTPCLQIDLKQAQYGSDLQKRRTRVDKIPLFGTFFPPPVPHRDSCC